MDLTALYRNTTLAIAGAKPVKSVIGRYGWRLGVGRFVAGEDIRSAVPVLLAIQASGRRVILDLLGEFVESESASRAVADAVKECVAVARASGVEPYFSVKPTQLGLGVGSELAFELADGIASVIGAAGGHLCLDMENVPYVDGTLDLYDALRRAGHHHVSTVLQSYLFRTPDDLDRLSGIAAAYPGVTTAVRLVKGAYRETAEHAIQDVAGIEEAYRTLAYRALGAGLKLNVGTHDEGLQRELLAYAKGAALGHDRYEVQMLYGVKPQLQERLSAAGLPVRVYVPFGSDWYGYFSRRLAERPANLAFVARGLFG